MPGVYRAVHRAVRPHQLRPARNHEPPWRSVPRSAPARVPLPLERAGDPRAARASSPAIPRLACRDIDSGACAVSDFLITLLRRGAGRTAEVVPRRPDLPLDLGASDAPGDGETPEVETTA